MQAFDDIFEIWPSLSAMAADLDQLEDTVYRWRRRGRVPEDIWSRLIEKAALRGKLVAPSDLMRLNGTIKRRGRPRGKKNCVEGEAVA